MKTNNTIPFMYMVGYDQNFMDACKTGWGCGYVAIPENLYLYQDHVAQKHAESLKCQEDDSYFWNYFDLIQLPEEITYTDYRVIDGVSYLVIGFDTAHSYNSKSHDFNYVFTQTKKILDLVLSYNQ